MQLLERGILRADVEILEGRWSRLEEVGAMSILPLWMSDVCAEDRRLLFLEEHDTALAIWNQMDVLEQIFKSTTFIEF